MTDRRKHRGPHSSDSELFAHTSIPKLRQAVSHVSWLLSRGYPPESSLKLVGDHFSLVLRQRMAVGRSACSDQSRRARKEKCVSTEPLSRKPLFLDGYNVLTTIEAALAGGFLLVCRDGCVRDMASMHGSYRKVEETLVALECLGATLEALGLEASTWYFDSPVSNSGRLKTLMTQLAVQKGWTWNIELVSNADRRLIECPGTVATADSHILDRCETWLNLVPMVLARCQRPFRSVDLDVD